LAEWFAWAEREGGRWATGEDLADTAAWAHSALSVSRASSRDSMEGIDMGSYGHDKGLKGG
jgi:hypothetical protein